LTWRPVSSLDVPLDKRHGRDGVAEALIARQAGPVFDRRVGAVGEEELAELGVAVREGKVERCLALPLPLSGGGVREEC
jgi:hypothetical protein